MASSPSFGRALISSTAAWIAFSPRSVSAPWAERPWTWTQASMSPISATRRAGRSPRARSLARAELERQRCAIRCRRAPRRPGRRRRRRARSRSSPAATRRARGEQAGDDAALVVDGAEAVNDVALDRAAPARWARSCRRGRRTRAPGRRSRARGCRGRSRCGTREQGSHHSTQSASIRSTIRPSEPEGDGMSTSSASRSRASATVAGVGAQPRLDLLPGADPGLEVVGLDLGDRVRDRARVGGLAELRRHRGSAAALTIANPFWAAIAWAGLETK